MIYLKWVIIFLVILISLVAWFFQNKIHSNLKKFDVKNAVLSYWVLKPENLNEEGRHYRKMIFICWAVIIGLALVYFNIK